jgi:hypothetical protein
MSMAPGGDDQPSPWMAWHLRVRACVAVHTFSKSDRSEDRSSVQGFPTSIYRLRSVVVLAGDQLASSAARVGRPEPSERVVCKPIPSHPIQSRPDHAHHFFRESSLPPSCVAVGPTCRQGQRRPLTRRPWAGSSSSSVQPLQLANPFFPCARSARTHDNPVLENEEP